MIEISSYTDVGRVRDKNEDSHDVISLSNSTYLCMVADGVGGSAGGEVASQLALETVSSYLQTAKEDFPVECRKYLLEAIKRANQEIYEQGRADPTLYNMATTLTALVCQGHDVWLGHVGDSRGYLVRKNSMEQITKDHSLVEELVRHKKITPEEAKIHPYRNMLTKALGFESSVAPETYQLQVKPGDIILLCTDGLTNMVPEDEICQGLENQEFNEVAKMLTEKALSYGGVDNITAVALKWVK